MKNIFLPLLFSLGIFAQDEPAPVELSRLETMDGKVYEELANVKVTASRISFRHSGGLASVKIVRLSEDLRAALGYDPAAAVEEERKERAAEAAHYAAVAKMAENEKSKKTKMEVSERAGTMGAVKISRAVSDYTRYEALFRMLAKEQRERDFRNAGDARYRTYGK